MTPDRTTPDPLRRRVVEPAWVAGRREPDQRTEMTTQWLCGEVLGVVDDGGDGPWVRVRGPGGYVAWVHAGGLGAGSAAEVAAWDEAATSLSLGVRLTASTDGSAGTSGEASGPPPGEAREDGRRAGAPASSAPEAPDVGPEAGRPAVPRYLPWGARVAPADGARVLLPGGRTAQFDPQDGVVAASERSGRFPREGSPVAETALGWRGVPYLWGGRTREGADCSGFVQAVYATHGVDLPRDSGDQLAAGPAVREREAGRPGDLIFFGEGPDAVTHVALALGEGRVVHAAARNGSVAVDDLEGRSPLVRRLRERLVGATRPLAAG